MMAAPDVSQLSFELQDIILTNKSLQLIENGKIRCKLSGHEIPCRLDAIEQYVSGKKYQKLSKEAQIDLSQYKDHIIPSTKPNQEHLLFCKLTCRHINNTVDSMQNHIKGKKFQRAFSRWTKCQAEGVKFKPNAGRTMKFERTSRHAEKDDKDDEDDKKSVDSLSDLYPAEDFKDLSLNDSNDEDGDKDDDDDDNKMSVSSPKSIISKKIQGRKRKAVDKKPKVLKSVTTKHTKTS